MSKTILIIKSEPIEEVIQATCLIKGFKQAFESPKITWITSEECVPYLKFNKHIKKICPIEEVRTTLEGASSIYNNFDIAVNLDYTEESAKLLYNSKAAEQIGLIWDYDKIAPANDKAQYFIDVMTKPYYQERNKSHYFQLIYQVCNMKWRGQGYAINFKPQYNPDKYPLGIVSNADKHAELTDILKKNNVKYHPINFTTDPLTVMGSIWQCKNILCQPDHYMHVAMAYHKNIIVPAFKLNRKDFCFFNQNENVLKTEDVNEILKHVQKVLKHEDSAVHRGPQNTNGIREDLPPSK
jgi:hypothetical protein